MNQRMKDEKIRKLENALDKLFENLELIKKETITRLGGKEALHIIDFHANNWIDIIGWIFSKYDRKEQTGITFFQFNRLFKEMYGLQFLFHNGYYPMIYRNLRYILELISQAYYIDSKYPKSSLDEQIEKIKGIEEKTYGWNLIKSVLCKILDSNEKSIPLNFKLLWDYLNKHVHPSAKQLDLIVVKDFLNLVTVSFNEDLAREAIRATDEVFDIINMIIFKKFPKIKELALDYKFISEWEEYLPNTMKFIRE